MAKYTQAQKEAMDRYLENKSNINIILLKTDKERYKEFAKKKGISLTVLIQLALEKYINSEEN